MKISVCTGRPVLEPCGLKDLNYQVDTYIGCEHCCWYCYVLGQAETDWSKEIRIHEDIEGRLSSEIEKVLPQTVYMGYHTDPYQPCESECLQTRKVLKLFLEKGFSASILTKSSLVTRDIDILKKMKNAAVSVSVAFNNDETRRLFEGNTMDTGKRVEALARLKDAGIKTGVLLCPVIPYVTNAMELIDGVQKYADTIWIYGLSINSNSDRNWLNVKQILDENFQDSAPRIENAVFSKEHPYWVELRNTLEDLKQNRQLNLNIHL